MKLKIINSRAQATQTKTVFWIIGILVLSAIIFIIFQFDLFGYIQNLPSFGEERGEILEVSEEDIPSGVDCGVETGRILTQDQVKQSLIYSLFRLSPQQHLFAFRKNFEEEGTSKKLAKTKYLVVTTRSSEEKQEDLKEFSYKGDIGTFWDSEIVLGGVDSSGIFKMNIWFLDHCKDTIEPGKRSFYSYSDIPSLKESKMYQFFAEKMDGCLFLSRLHYSRLFANRYLCKTQEQVEKEALREISSFCSLYKNYGSFLKISRGNEDLVKIKSPECANPSTNPLGISFGNAPVSFFWNALEKKAYARYDGKNGGGISIPRDYDFLSRQKKNCKSYFSRLNCEIYFDQILFILNKGSFESFLT
jgi:hypothetical protein